MPPGQVNCLEVLQCSLIVKILADSRVTHAREAFSQLGEVSLFDLPLAPESARDVDILMLRSELKVDAQLLRFCRPTFIGCPTAGTDHVDFDYLREQGIAFTNAPGCNSDSVRDYVMAALLQLAARQGRSLRGRTLGVVGVGRIGRRVAACASALGVQVLLNDPPRARLESDFQSLPLDELMEADFLTLHVPLTVQGEDPTHHLFDRDRLSRIKSGAVLINASRGAVVDGEALKRELQKGRLQAVLDVWENEPEIDCELLQMVQRGTSHVAGLTIEAKARGTEVILRACCRHLGVDPVWSLSGASQPRKLDLPQNHRRLEKQLHGLVRQVCDIEEDDRLLRELLQLRPQERAAGFRGLRRSHRRHELTTFTVELPADSPLADSCRALGLGVKQTGP